MDTLGNNKIDDYLMGRLEGEALKAFELKLQTDKVFANEVAEQKQAMDLLEKASDIEMKREVREVQARYEEGKNSKPVLRILRPWRVAAAAILLLAVSYWVFQGPTNEQLFAQYYTAYDTGYGDRDASDPAAIRLAEASQFYKQKEYAKALAIFESQSTVKDGRLQLMTGISHLELSQYDKAIASFDQLIISKDPVFQYHAIWYSAMTYLKSGDLESAKAQLEKLVQANDPNGVYNQDKAKEILKQL